MKTSSRCAVLVLFLIQGEAARIDIRQTVDNAAKGTSVSHQKLTHQTFEKDGLTYKVFDTARPGPYKQMVAASAPVTTNCGLYREKGADEAYVLWSHYCGVRGLTLRALEDHIEKVWKLILTAYETLEAKLEGRGERNPSTLRIFVAPEWTFRRYPEPNADITWVDPLSASDLKLILSMLEEHMSESQYDFSDWLVVPGTVQWGVNFAALTPDSITHAVFNSAPVFYGGRHIYLHNKFVPVSNYLDSSRELWGYRLMEQFKTREEKRTCQLGCDSVREKLRAFMTEKLNKVVADDIVDYGTTVAADTLVINGLAIGVDICADLRAGIGHGIRAAERLKNLQHISQFDIQLLIASGMRFDIPEGEGTNGVMVREGGYALSADGSAGYQGGSRLYSLNPHNSAISWGSRGATDSDGILTMADDFTQYQQDETLGTDWQKRKAALGCESSNKNTQLGCRVMWDCRYSFTPDDSVNFRSRSSNGMAAQQVCQKQVGNWDVLKIWSTPLPLQAPRAEVLALGIDESGVVEKDRVRH